MSTIAFLGGGNMGQAMVYRLLAAGRDVAVYNRTLSNVRNLEAAGARICATPRNAAAGAAAVLASVSDDDASRAVWTGQDGALTADLPPGTPVVEHSTLSHDWVLDLSRHVQGRGLRFLDCPVAGRPNVAAAGQLVVFAGAAADDLKIVKPMLAPISREIFHFGAPGAGTAFKLIYNLMGVVQIVALAEGLASCEAAGIDLATAVRAFATCSTGSTHVVKHGGFMASDEHEDPPAFTALARVKDSTYGVEFEEKLGQVPRVGRAALEAYRHMVDSGMADAADSKLLKHIRAPRRDEE